jgi:hypothetical protein
LGVPAGIGRLARSTQIPSSSPTLLEDARKAVDKLVPISGELARRNVEQASGMMSLIIDAARNGRATPSLVDNLLIVWNLLREAQATDVRPRHRPSWK